MMSLSSNASVEAPCILCDVKINLKERNHACVGIKGLETINNFSVKHNELHPEKKLPIFEFDGSELYVHTDCRKRHTNTRRYEQKKRKREDESTDVGPTLRSERGSFSFRTDCCLCGRFIDKAKAKRFPGNLDYEYSRVMSLEIKKPWKKSVKNVEKAKQMSGLSRCFIGWHASVTFRQKKPSTIESVSSISLVVEIFRCCAA